MHKPQMGLNEFQDRLYSGQLSRRRALGVLGSVGVVATAFKPGAARAAQVPLVFEWSGYEVPELYPPYVQKHGEEMMPEFSFFGTEQEMATKIRSGFRPAITHPCAESWGRIADAGLLKPIDTSRLSNWNDLFPGLRDHDSIRDADGNIMMLPADWGNSSIVYRTDLYEGEETWCMLFDERYEGRLSNIDSESVVLTAGLCQGYGLEAFNMTDDMLAEVRPLVEKSVKLTRFYWNDQTEIEQAMAAGEIVAAYAWNSAVKNLRSQGVPVAYAVPKEGILTWLCGLSLVVDGEGDDNLVYDYLDAWISPEAGKFLIEAYGYGHPNQKAFQIADPELVAGLGFPTNPMEMLATGMMFRPYDPAVLEKMVRMFDDVKIGS
ncbi:MAG: extracellular solute-binding protein [Alphaproteobacteria bacterium]|nr:extracellular solute-binding protein [Alphaproteobacteria bacterium]